jgi:hypothetical protein
VHVHAAGVPQRVLETHPPQDSAARTSSRQPDRGPPALQPQEVREQYHVVEQALDAERQRLAEFSNVRLFAYALIMCSFVAIMKGTENKVEIGAVATGIALLAWGSLILWLRRSRLRRLRRARSTLEDQLTGEARLR